MIKVLFVCLGNICRSPMGEGLLIHLVKEEGLSDKISVDSAGTSGWHIGEPADRRMRQTAESHGIHLPSKSRQIRLSDFQEFDYILAMDSSNLRDLQDLYHQVKKPKAQIFKMRYFDPQAPDSDVPDPYYGGDLGFEEVYEMLDRATRGLMAHIRAEHGI